MSIIDLKLPKYNVTLPVSKKKVVMRPFTVKEEKILLLAQEDNDINRTVESIDQIINNCTFGKVTIDSINKIDAEYLFIQIRNKSKGEGVSINAICKSCKEKTPMVINFDDVKTSNLDVKNDAIQIQDDVWVTLKYPTMRESMLIESDDGIKAVAMILDTIIQGENVKNVNDYSIEDRIEFVESMTNAQLIKFTQFLDKFPTLYMDIKYECKCGHKNEIHIESLESFFA